jgi:NAD:arginine ADP-ribosyltransferase
VTAIFPINDGDAVKAMICRITSGDDAHYAYCCQQARLTLPCPLGLTSDERLAVWIYSSTDARWYERINRELRELNPSPDVQFFAQLLVEAIAKLPQYEGEVYRGMTVPDLDAHIEDYEISKVVEWAAFTSSSKMLDKTVGGNVLFIITSQNGRVLGAYADKPSDGEILFRTNSRFEVLAAERLNGLLVISVAETTQ